MRHISEYITPGRQPEARMSDAALNDFTAESIMGWKRSSLARDAWWIQEDAAVCTISEWHPTTDHNDAARVRARIAELELQASFERELSRILGLKDGAVYCYGFICMQASLRTQAEAAKAAWEARHA